MTLVIGGCSFTYNNEMTWAGKVAESHDVFNVASVSYTHLRAHET